MDILNLRAVSKRLLTISADVDVHMQMNASIGKRSIIALNKARLIFPLAKFQVSTKNLELLQQLIY
jgi:hypothetical protein